jgi:hypothetical protein
MKCVVLSLHRSGTRSTAAYLASLGLRTRHWPVDHDGIDLEAQIAGRETDREHVATVLTPVFADHDAVADVPMPALYREMTTRDPETRFLLAYRPAFDWIRSVRWKTRDRDLSPYERVLYWMYFPSRPRRLAELSDNQLLGMHGQHLADVVAWFERAGPDRLGIFDLYAAETGPRIAAFLGLPAAGPLPHLFPRPNGVAASGAP